MNTDDYLHMIIDAIPSPVFLVDEDLHLMVSHGLCPECAQILYSKLD